MGVVGLVRSFGWNVQPHRGLQRPARTRGLARPQASAQELPRHQASGLELARPQALSQELNRLGRSPPFERIHSRGITPTGDPGDRRTGAATKQKRKGRNRNKKARTKGRRSKSLQIRDRDYWHFQRGGRGASGPGNQWRGGATAPRNRQPRKKDAILDTTRILEEETAPEKPRKGKQGDLEDAFVIGPNNLVLDARELFFEENSGDDVDNGSTFKAFDGDIEVVNVSLSVETTTDVTTEQTSENILVSVDNPYEDNEVGKSMTDGKSDSDSSQIKGKKSDISKSQEKNAKKTEKTPKKKKGKFPNNIRDVLREFQFPSRLDEMSFFDNFVGDDENVTEEITTDLPSTTDSSTGILTTIQPDSEAITTESTDTTTEIQSTTTSSTDLTTVVTPTIITFTTIIPTTFENQETTNIPTTTENLETTIISSTTATLDKTDDPVTSLAPETSTVSDEDGITTFTPSEAFRTRIEDDIVYDDIDNEISDELVEGRVCQIKLPIVSTYCRTTQGRAIPGREEDRGCRWAGLQRGCV